MRTASSALIAFLLSKQPFWTADLFTVTLSGGTVYHWTSSDQNIVYGGNLFSAMGPALSRTRWNVKNTLDVPEMEVKLISSGLDFSGANLKLLIHNGLLDGAKITLNRAFMAAFQNTSLGAPLLFSGQVSTISLGALGATITVKGANVLLQQYMPRNQYQLSCIHTLYDSGCKVVRASYSVAGIVGSGALSASEINWATPRTDGARFGLGYVTMTSGVANGEVRTIQMADNNNMIVGYPFYQVPAVGDTFVAAYGCPRDAGTCANIFGNLQNYRGFPYVPPAETAY